MFDSHGPWDSIDCLVQNVMLALVKVGEERPSFDLNPSIKMISVSQEHEPLEMDVFDGQRPVGKDFGNLLKKWRGSKRRIQLNEQPFEGWVVQIAR